MQQALPLAKGYFIDDQIEELALKKRLDELFSKKISFQEFSDLNPNLLFFSRTVSTHHMRTLLHWAVLENQLEMIRLLGKDPMLKFKRDIFDLSPIDIARFLNQKEALRELLIENENLLFPKLPPLERFEYLCCPTFETKEELEQVLSLVSKAKENDTISAEKIWMGIYFDKEIQNGSHPPISIRYVDRDVGFGVFAEKKIPPCSFVGEYTGVIKERKKKQLKEKRYALRYPVWEGKKNFTIDSEEKGNFTRFINHSSRPNLGLQSVYWKGLPRMIFIALKEISEGSQLTFDYGPIFWKNLSQSPKEFDDL